MGADDRVGRDAGGVVVRAAGDDAWAGGFEHVAESERPSLSNCVLGALVDVAEFRNANFILGSPATVAERLLQFKEESDVDWIDLLAHVPGLSHEALQQTLTLFAREVAPRMGIEMLTPSPA